MADTSDSSPDMSTPPIVSNDQPYLVGGEAQTGSTGWYNNDPSWTNTFGWNQNGGGIYDTGGTNTPFGMRGSDNGGLAYDPGFLNYLFSNNMALHTNQGPGYVDEQMYQNNKPMEGTQIRLAQDSGVGSPFDYAMRILAGASGAYIGGATAAGFGAGSTATGAASGAGAGAFGAGASTGGDPSAMLKGAATGALGGAIGGANPSQYAGITDPDYARYFNNAVSSGTKALVNGGNVGQAVLGSATNSGLSAGLQAGANAMFGDNSTAYNNSDYEPGGYTAPDTSSTSGGGLPSIFGGGNYSPVPGMQSNVPNFGQVSGYSPMPQGPTDLTSIGLGMVGDNTVPMSSPSNRTTAVAGTNPLLDAVKKGMGFGTPQFGGNMDNMAGNLMQLYQSWRNNNQLNGLANNLNSLYGQNSPYANQLRQTLLRQDAAAGRRSQVGPREVELQARLAELNSRNAPTLQGIMSQGMNNQGQMLQSLLRMGMPMARNYWQQPQGGMTGANPAGDYNYQNGSDIGWNPGGP